MMGYCSDCYMFVHAPWFCNKWDTNTEEPKGECYSKEPVKADKEGQE
jgi:hypothetical protein